MKKLSLKWYKLSFWSLLFLLTGLIAFRGGITACLKMYLGITDPDMWVDKGVMGLAFLLLLAVFKWIKRECPGFIRRIIDSVSMDWVALQKAVNSIDNRVLSVQTDMHDMDTRLTGSLVTLQSDLGDIEGRLRHRDEIDKASHSDKAKLVRIRMDNITFLKKLSSELHRYAILKANSFIDFVMAVHATGFYVTEEDTTRRNNPDMDFDRLSDDASCTIGKLRKEAADMLDQKFVDLFFSKHDEAVRDYMNQVKRIIEDKTNYKHRRFQEISESFLAEFLEVLHHTYIDYLKKD